MTDGERTDRPRLPVRTAVVFALTSLLAVTVVAVAFLWVARREATDAAVREARDLAVSEARSTVTPALSDGLVTQDRSASSTLDSVVRERVLSDRVVRVKVWRDDGTILYSDEPALVGQQFDLEADERDALQHGTAAAGVSDLSKPENANDRDLGKLLEVYVGVRTPSGEPVLYEEYLRYASVDAAGQRTLTAVLPALLGALALLFVVQIPLGWWLARRVERGRSDERRLLRRAVEAGEVERLHIAADLHDGVVQSLVGTSLSLSAAANEAERAGLDDVATRVSAAADDLRQGVRDLRSLIVAIAPPRLHDEGLATALRDLVSPLSARGLTAALTVDDELVLTPGTETLLYRGAQEAVRNVVRHAHATRVELSLEQSDGAVRLEVTDDGTGFTLNGNGTGDTGDGHVGLRLLDELVRQAGGQLDITSAPGAGTTVRVEVPA